MKIVFMGTPAFAVPSLEILLKNNYEIPAVVTVPDKKKGRGQQISVSDVKKFASENKIEILQPENLNEKNFINAITELNPDLIVVVAFRILPKEVFTIPRYGSINLHASLLPKYRGAAPINWAIINGEKETGVTTFFLKEKVDTGNIILQKKIEISDSDDAGSIHDKLSLLGADAVRETVELIKNNKASVSEQDNTLASPAPKIFREDCLIKWNNKARKIYNFIRGVSPYPAAFSNLNGKKIKIYKSNPTDFLTNESPGKIIINGKKIFVAGKDKLIEITELQSEGKKRMKASDFINGINAGAELRFE